MSTEPLPSWTLDDWLKAVGATPKTFDARLIIEGFKVKSFLYEARRNRQTIQSREIALAFIRELNAFALKNHSPVMSCANLAHHAEIFLSSKICRMDLGILRPTEFAAICPGYDPYQTAPLYDPIIMRVQPPPPLKLFGREQDLNAATNLIREYPVCVMSGIGGNGKTALAWHLVQQCQRSAKPFEQFEWVTDKRMVFDLASPTAELKSLEHEPLSFHTLLRGMVVRFQWEEMYGISDDDLFDACARRLQQRPYLLVVDNLETVENHQLLVTKLLHLLGSGSGNTPPSRAVLTSRHSLEMLGCGSWRLQGIEDSQRIPYILYLEPTINFPTLDPQQLAQLAEATCGNPLFIQLALQRYALAPHQFTQILQDLYHTDTAFQYIFAPLVDHLRTEHQVAYWLATCAAHLPVIYQTDLLEYWLAQYPQDDRHDAYYQALGLLRQRMMIEMRGNEVIMHPLIKGHLNSYA
jgi:hypothetical protein